MKIEDKTRILRSTKQLLRVERVFRIVSIDTHVINVVPVAVLLRGLQLCSRRQAVRRHEVQRLGLGRLVGAVLSNSMLKVRYEALNYFFLRLWHACKVSGITYHSIIIE